MLRGHDVRSSAERRIAHQRITEVLRYRVQSEAPSMLGVSLLRLLCSGYFRSRYQQLAERFLTRVPGGEEKFTNFVLAAISRRYTIGPLLRWTRENRSPMKLFPRVCRPAPGERGMLFWTLTRHSRDRSFVCGFEEAICPVLAVSLPS